MLNYVYERSTQPPFTVVIAVIIFMSDCMLYVKHVSTAEHWQNIVSTVVYSETSQLQTIKFFEMLFKVISSQNEIKQANLHVIY